MIVLFIFLNFVCFINIRDNHQKIEEFKHQFLKVVKEENEIKKIIIFPIGHKFNTNGEEIYETENDVRSYFYGKSFGVAKIIEISESKFIEEVDFEVKPNFFEDIKGTHTYNFKNGLMVIDFVKIENTKK